MHISKKNLLGLCILAASYAVFFAPKAQANDQIVWHCSKNSAPSSEVELNAGSSLAQTDDLFYLSSLMPLTISISLSDLTDVYSGRRVQLGPLHLTGCFISGDKPLNQAAFESIGLRWNALQQMTRRSAITQRQLNMVQNEQAMIACIANNFPAVGYLPRPHEDDGVAPCF